MSGGHVRPVSKNFTVYDLIEADYNHSDKQKGHFVDESLFSIVYMVRTCAILFMETHCSSQHREETMSEAIITLLMHKTW